MSDYGKALTSLAKDKRWIAQGNTFEWHDDPADCPTVDQIEAEMIRIGHIEQYQNKRIAEYPPIEEQLDMIFHHGIDAWKAEIQKIKDKYPKTES